MCALLTLPFLPLLLASGAPAQPIAVSASLGHDGGRAEVHLDLKLSPGGAEGIPLLGDVDGDGRADACLLRGTRLQCGLFGARGGRPRSILKEDVFSEPGAVPLPGDLDAF